MGVEGCFDAPHHVQTWGIQDLGQEVALEEADAVLTRYCSPQLVRREGDLTGSLMRLYHLCLVGEVTEDVGVEVAVADVSPHCHRQIVALGNLSDPPAHGWYLGRRDRDITTQLVRAQQAYGG